MRRYQYEGLDVVYVPGFVGAEDADAWLRGVHSEVEWTKPTYVIAGRSVQPRRHVSWHADEGYVYAYSGQEHAWKPWTKTMEMARAYVQTRMGVEYQGCLVNLYLDGQSSIAFHADDETDLGEGSVIACLSLGATRTFVVRHQDGTEYRIPVEHGSLTLMGGRTQQVAKHAVLKDAKVRDPRISLTFRQLAGSAKRG